MGFWRGLGCALGCLQRGPNSEHNGHHRSQITAKKGGELLPAFLFYHGRRHLCFDLPNTAGHHTNRHDFLDPVIMSIIRSSRNPRLPQLQPLSARCNLIQPPPLRFSDICAASPSAPTDPAMTPCQLRQRAKTFGQDHGLLGHRCLDATVDDPHNGSTFFVDFHTVDSSLAPSHLHIEKPGDPVLSPASSAASVTPSKSRVMADSHQRDAEHRDALLLPFVMTPVGGFTPSRP